MRRYVVLVRRENGTLDTYQQDATDYIDATVKTVHEFKARNNLDCKFGMIELVAVKETLNNL